MGSDRLNQAARCLSGPVTFTMRAPGEAGMVSLGLWRSPAFRVREAQTHILALALTSSDLGGYFCKPRFHYLGRRDNDASGLLGGLNEITYISHPVECPPGSEWPGNDSYWGLIFLKYILGSEEVTEKKKEKKEGEGEWQGEGE